MYLHFQLNSFGKLNAYFVTVLTSKGLLISIVPYPKVLSQRMSTQCKFSEAIISTGAFGRGGGIVPPLNIFINQNWLRDITLKPFLMMPSFYMYRDLWAGSSSTSSTKFRSEVISFSRFYWLIFFLTVLVIKDWTAQYPIQGGRRPRTGPLLPHFFHKSVPSRDNW